MGYLVDRGASARDSRGGRAMGDAEPNVPRSPTVDLIAQVNRFRRAGQFGTAIYPLEIATGNITPDLARTAIIIHQARLLQSAIFDRGTTAGLAAAATGLATPVPFVMANLAMLTGSIAGYADAKGMPAADYHVSGGPKAGISPLVIAGAALGAVALLYFVGRKSR